MANTKISALTAATTPLAGTEVLPIVQSSTTKQVSVADLTAGRSVSAASLSLTGSPLPATSGGTGQSSYAVGDLLYASTTTVLSKLADVATGNALISGGVGVAPSWGKIGLTTHVSGTLGVGNGGTGTTTAFTAGSVVFAGASGVYSQDNANFFWDATNHRLGIGTTAPNRNVEFAFSGGSTLGISNSAQGAGVLYGRIALYSTGFSNSYIDYGGEIRSYSGGGVDYSDLRFYTASGATSTEKVRIFSAGGVSIGDTTDPGAGNLRLGTGNLVQGTAAKGINFTANTPASGMTSQLLNWYEEGTWTPVVTAGTGTITTVGAVSGRYTRTGRIVTLEFRITITTNGTGGAYLLIAGMPFASNTSLYFVGCGTRISTGPLGLCISANTSTQMVMTYSDGTYPGANGVQLQGQVTYSI